MADEEDGKKVVVPIGLRPARAQEIVREIAADTNRVILGDHAKQRMEERGISDIEVYRILQRGFVLEAPERTEFKEWKCKVVMQLKGNRDAGVIVIILTAGRLFAKTVEWED
jgi:Domain of unknown function (DUF4258)